VAVTVHSPARALLRDPNRRIHQLTSFDGRSGVRLMVAFPGMAKMAHGEPA
jgi:hypothetical protein